MDSNIDLRTYSPLTFAFLGDGVYGLYVRSALVKRGNTQARNLHNEASRIVAATAQAKVYDILDSEDELDEDELDIMHRGCNAHVTHQAKNATSMEYHKATGLEALFGYLYLLNRTDRIEELITRFT
ncbi:MAG: ribonuclease III [Lachnospiraceae bacterium]|nr:ribonuclease III [Lachnospiraceae bacterium]